MEGCFLKIALPASDEGPKCNFFICVQTLSTGFNCLNTNNAYSTLQMILNEKVIDYKVVDLIEIYNFRIKLISLRCRLKCRSEIFKNRFYIL